MKISELIPSELPGIVIRTLQGRMTGEDHDYLLEKCGIHVLESWFNDDDSIELDIKLDNGATTTVDLGDGYSLLELENYNEIAFYALLKHAASLLPGWVYDRNKFSCGILSSLTMMTSTTLTVEDFTNAFESAWNVVFDGQHQNSQRCSVEDGPFQLTELADLERRILNEMFTGKDPLPSWMEQAEAGHGDPTRTWCLPISIELLETLEELYKCTAGRNKPASLPIKNFGGINEVTPPPMVFDDEAVLQVMLNEATPPSNEDYVSPFTGKSV